MSFINCMIQNIQYIYAGSGDSVTEMVEMQWERYDVLNFYGVVVRNNTHSCLFVVVMWWMFVQYIGFYEQFVNMERKYEKKKNTNQCARTHSTNGANNIGENPYISAWHSINIYELYTLIDNCMHCKLQYKLPGNRVGHKIHSIFGNVCHYLMWFFGWHIKMLLLRCVAYTNSRVLLYYWCHSKTFICE